MPRVILTTQVQDPVKWEAGFRTHGAIFKSYTVNAPVQYSVVGNEVAILMEVSSVETMQAEMAKPATAEAMAFDGVKRETFKMFVLDKDVKL